MKIKNNIFSVVCILFLFGLLNNINAQETVFNQKRLEYFQNEGSNLNYYCERIWAWLEKIKNGQINGSTYYVTDVDGRSKPVIEVIHNIIRCWGTPWAGGAGPVYVWAWKYGPQQSGVMLSWILWRYGDVIQSSDRDFIFNLLNNDFRRRDFNAANPNSMIADMVSRYLWSQDNQDVNVIYSYDPPPTQNMREFSWEGRTYTPGQEYNSYNLCRDWLNFTINTWLFSGLSELDSPIYTWCFVHCFSALHEWAKDPVMKQKAKMMVDFIMLDSILDFTANQWGGALGRKYEEVFRYSGWDRFYWDIFCGMNTSTHEPSRSIFISSYRLPDVIYDIGDLSDEPDNYYHINKEFNIGIYCVPGTGKWNWVTKFYSLGCGRANEWQLCIKSNKTPGTYGRKYATPFRLWINSKQPGDDAAEWTFTSGEYGYQYKNAMLSFGTVLHISTGAKSFDIDQQISGWRFLKEDRTMVAIKLGSNVSGVEVAIEGVDYSSFDAFKQAIIANASLIFDRFITSRGDIIETRKKWYGSVYYAYEVVKKQGSTVYEPVWDFPFPRIAAVDYRGNDIVKWVGNNMIVEKNGKRLTYDFDNWIVTESLVTTDTVAPSPPTGISVPSNH